MVEKTKEQKKKDIVGEIDPTKNQCDCCKQYFDEIEVHPFGLESGDDHFNMIVQGIGIFYICEPCFKVLKAVYNGGIDRVREKTEKLNESWPVHDLPVQDCLVALKNWHDQLRSESIPI